MEPGKLTPENGQNLSSWLNSCSNGPGILCPLCGQSEYSIGLIGLIAISVTTGDVANKLKTIQPCAAVTCKNCGHIRLIDANKAGLKQ